MDKWREYDEDIGADEILKKYEVLNNVKHPPVILQSLNMLQKI